MSDGKESRDTLVYKAKLAEEAERYDDMVKSVKALGMRGDQLNVEERNLLSVAYKNVVGARRASWRVLSSIKAKEAEEGKGGDDNQKLATVSKFIEEVEKELDDICQDLLNLLEEHLLAKDESKEGQVFYLKMAGDYYRYLAEVSSGDARADHAKKATAKYDDATAAAKDLASTNPIRLGLALNFSVFHYEINNQPQKACQLAKQAFDDAIADLDGLPEEQYKDATLIMQLIRDNLTLWTSDQQDDEGEKGPEKDGTAVEDL